MAIIYSYPRNADILPTDIIVGTTTRMLNGKPKNETKNFKVGDLADYITTGYVPYTGAYQDVVLGDHALSLTNGIVTTLLSPSLGVRISNEAETNTIGPSSISILNNTLSTGSSLNSSGILSLRTNGVAAGLLSATALTNNITLKFPNKPTGEYTIATTEDVGVIPTLQQVTDAGNITANNIIVLYDANNYGVFGSYGFDFQNDGQSFQYSPYAGLEYSNYSVDGYYIIDLGYNGCIYTRDMNNGYGGFLYPNLLSLESPGSYVNLDTQSLSFFNGSNQSELTWEKLRINKGTLKTDLLTNDITLEFPNKTAGTYTIATTSDIPSFTPAALTKTNDTNVTLTLGGTPSTALLQGVSLTLGWTGTLADSRIASAATWNAKQNALSGTGLVKSTAGTISYITDNSSNWDTAYTSRITNLTTTGTGAATLISNVLNIPTPPTATFTSLTTTGSSGSSTLLSGVLNVPTYTLSGLGGGTWATLNYPTWTTGTPFVKMTAAGTFALDTNTYLTGITSGQVTTALGYTPVTNARTLTINGVGYDLTADRSWTIPTFTSPLTTKGDIYVRSTVDTRLPVGTDGQYLMSDSTQSTGLKWQTLSLSGYVPYSSYGTNNVSANNFFDGFTTVTASGTLITLTVDSTPSYLVTGSGGQTIKLPNATTLPNGTTFEFNNNQSSGAILVNNNSNTLVKSVPSGGYLNLVLIDNSTAAGSWDTHFQAPSNVSWSTNTFDYGGSITSAAWNGVNVALNRGGTGANTASGARTNLGSTTVGDNFFTLTSPSAITFVRINADNTISTLDASTFRTAIGAGTSSTNGTVTSVAALTLGTSGTDLTSTVVNGTTTPVITLNVPTASATNRGALSSTDWNSFNNRLLGVHTLKLLSSGQSTILSINGAGLTTTIGVSNRIYLIPYIPNVSFTCSSLFTYVSTLLLSANARILIYSDVSGVPTTKLYESTNLDCSTIGAKTATTAFSFVAGTTYWIGIHSSSTPSYYAYNIAQLLPISISTTGTLPYSSYASNQTFGSAPTTLTGASLNSTVIPYVGITF